jgi:hypothetical protein
MNAWRTQLVALILAAGLGTVYCLTLPPGPTWGDGLEFASVVHGLGIPHPTGYPLYVMLGKVWELAFPLRDAAWRLSVLSVVYGVLAALLLFGAVREAIPEGEEWEDVPQVHHWRRVLIPAGTAMAWGLTPAVWQVANIAEVYTLFAVFLHGLTWLMLKNMRLGWRRLDLLIAFIFGLSLTHHGLIAVLIPAVVGYYIFRLRRLVVERSCGHAIARSDDLTNSRSHDPTSRSLALWLVCCGLLFLVGLTPILYLPVRAAMHPVINWGDPSTPQGLWWVLRGGEFPQMRFLATEGHRWQGSEIVFHLFSRLDLVLRLLLGEFIPLFTRGAIFTFLVAAALAALMALGWWRSRPALRWAIPVTAGLNLAIVSAYNIADFQSYLLPVISAGWFWLALGVMWAAEAVEGLFLRRRFTYTALVLGLLPMWLGFRFWDLCDRSREERADLWAAHVLEKVAPGALLITRADGDIYALWYAQQVDHLRPDVTVFASNFMWSGWYRAFFSDAQAQRLHFEALGGPPDARYYLLALFTGVIAPNLEARRPVYTCFNPYESPNAVLVTLWDSLFGPLKYDIVYLGQTREPDQAGSAVGPPDNALLPRGYTESIRRLGEPAPELYRIVDNPTLDQLARRLFARDVQGGYQAYLARQRRQMFGQLPLEQFRSERTE